MRRVALALLVASAFAGKAAALNPGQPLSINPADYRDQGRSPLAYVPFGGLFGAPPALPVQPAPKAVDAPPRRDIVAYRGPERPGTIIISTGQRRLYLVESGGLARRYAIGVGRDGFTWIGSHAISRKEPWPDWRPPTEMLKRRTDLPRYMAGGEENPLGARALYLGSTLYRIHGSNEPETIGHAVSSGCFRMTNADVIDLYDRVPVGTQVVVR